MSSKQIVKDSFSARAAEWMACYASEKKTLEQRNLLSRQRVALELLDVRPPALVLDAGCGSGEMSAKLLERGFDVRGIDIAEPMIHLASTRFGTDRFQVADLESIPFPDGTFDAVVCLGVIEYLQSDDAALCEIRRVLKPSGVAVIATPNGSSPLKMLDRALAKAGTGITHRTYSPRKWSRVLRANGLEIEKAIFHGWGWYRSRLGAIAVRLSNIIGDIRMNWIGAEEIVRVRVAK